MRWCRADKLRVETEDEREEKQNEQDEGGNQPRGPPLQLPSKQLSQAVAAGVATPAAAMNNEAFTDHSKHSKNSSINNEALTDHS